MEIKVRDLRKKEKYQVDDEYLNGYAKFCGIYGTAVYNSLCRHADKDQYSFPSIELMSEQHHCSRPSIIKGIRLLEKFNIIIVHKEKNLQGKQKNNGYTLLNRSEWRNPSKRDLLGTESMTFTQPSKRGLLDRVNEVDCKDTHIKDTHIKDIYMSDSKESDLFSKKSDPFQKFWKSYPKKEKKKQAREIWKRKKLDLQVEKIISFIDKAQKTDRWRKGFIKQPTTFLNSESWDDDLSAYNDVKTHPDNILKPNDRKYDKFN